MQKSDNSHTATTAHRKTRSSTTLNRKYVTKPSKRIDMTVPVKRSSKIKHFDSSAIIAEHKSQGDQVMRPATVHPMQARAISRMQSRTATPEVSGVTAKELKDRAIKKALAEASKVASGQDMGDDSKKNIKMHFGFGRIILALSCAAVAVFTIVYFVNLNMPDISMRVAAMQTGIEASYPSYIPKGFNLSSITSEDGKIFLGFNNEETGDSFSLVEENSSWDSNALLANFVKKDYGEDYSIIREQGLTIYVSGSNDATWVNGGIVYKIEIKSGVLDKKQIRSIAVSL